MAHSFQSNIQDNSNGAPPKHWSLGLAVLGQALTRAHRCLLPIHLLESWSFCLHPLPPICTGGLSWLSWPFILHPWQELCGSLWQRQNVFIKCPHANWSGPVKCKQKGHVFLPDQGSKVPVFPFHLFFPLLEAISNKYILLWWTTFGKQCSLAWPRQMYFLLSVYLEEGRENPAPGRAATVRYALLKEEWKQWCGWSWGFLTHRAVQHSSRHVRGVLAVRLGQITAKSWFPYHKCKTIAETVTAPWSAHGDGWRFWERLIQCLVIISHGKYQSLLQGRNVRSQDKGKGALVLQESGA